MLRVCKFNFFSKNFPRFTSINLRKQMLLLHHAFEHVWIHARYCRPGLRGCPINTRDSGVSTCKADKAVRHAHAQLFCDICLCILPHLLDTPFTGGTDRVAPHALTSHFQKSQKNSIFNAFLRNYIVALVCIPVRQTCEIGR